MATTSIWRVGGWLGKVVIYVENPDKTENPATYEKSDMEGRDAQGLTDVIEYAVQQQKTEKAVANDEGTAIMQRFVSGVNCSPSTARDEMIAVKKRFGKEDGTVAYHGYQSFAPGEADPQTAHEIGLKLAKKLWGKKYQVVVATHLDKSNHLHNHFVVNTVSFVDGIKYHRTEKDYYDMQRESDRLCREYGLSVIENPQRGKSQHYGAWRAEQEGRPTYLSLIKADVDTAIRQSMTERQFFYHLKQMGYDPARTRQRERQKAVPQSGRGIFPGKHPQADTGTEPSSKDTQAASTAVQASWRFEASQKSDRLSRPLFSLLLSVGRISSKAKPAAPANISCLPGRFDSSERIDRRGAAAVPSPH